MVVRKKVIVVGDGAVGKTFLISRFVNGEVPLRYTPTVFETQVTTLQVDGKEVELTLWDTAGQEDYDRLRPLSYPRSNCVIICFAIDDLDSLYNVPEKWSTEAKHYCAGVPVVLAGMKNDLREDSETLEKLKKAGEEPVSQSDGEKMAVRIGAFKYVECSAKANVNVKEIFEAAALAAIQMKPKKAACNLL